MRFNRVLTTFILIVALLPITKSGARTILGVSKIITKTEQSTLTDNGVWEHPFKPIAADSDIRRMLTSPDGLYLAGYFTQIGTVEADSIAFMDDTGIHSLAQGIDGSVYALAYYNGNLIVGGDFSKAGDIAVRNLARWDGTQWYPIGGGFSAEITSLAVKDGILYVGGDYLSNSEIENATVAMWDGTHWYELGESPDVKPENLGKIYISSICFSDNLLITAGTFDYAGGESANNIAAWDGSGWLALGDGLTDQSTQDTIVRSLVCEEDGVYAGGQFNSSGEEFMLGAAYWDGHQWQAMDAPTRFYTMIMGPDGNIYAAGDSICLMWDGTEWQELNGGNDLGYTFALAWYEDRLYAGSSEHPRFYVWRDEWFYIGNGLNGSVKSVTTDGKDLYAFGGFTQAGDEKARHVARWDGKKWHPLGGGLTWPEDPIPSGDRMLKWINGNLYVTGSFTLADNQPARYIAYWDGSSWHAMGNNLDWPPKALAYYQGRYYAAGNAILSGSHFASWNGSAWQAETSLDHHIICMEVLDGKLYAGTEWGGVQMWNGSTWEEVGTGFNGIIHSLVEYNQTIYAGGEQLRLNEEGVYGIAAWDGISWNTLDNALGPGVYMGPRVYDFEPTDRYLYVGGYFNNVSGLPILNITSWDGVVWEALGDEIIEGVDDLTEIDGKVYVAAFYDLALWREGDDGDHPVLGPIGSKSINELAELVFTATATFTSTLTFSLVDAPDGATMTAGGAFTWTPTEAQGPDEYTFTIKVCDDGSPTLCDQEEITVTVNEVNVAPVLTSIGDKSVGEGSLLSFITTANDADLPVNMLAYNLVNAPAGATITPVGVFNWMPSEAQGPGEYTFSVNVCDDGTPTLCDQEEITVTVSEAEPESTKVYLPCVPSQ